MCCAFFSYFFSEKKKIDMRYLKYFCRCSLLQLVNFLHKRNLILIYNQFYNLIKQIVKIDVMHVVEEENSNVHIKKNQNKTFLSESCLGFSVADFVPIPCLG